MADPVFQAVIAAIDKASGPLRAIATSFDKTGAAAQRVAKENERLDSKHSLLTLGQHVRIATGHFRQLQSTISSVHNSFAQFLPALGALGAGGSLVGLFALTARIADAAAEGAKLTEEIGISGKALGGLTFAAKMTHVSVEGLDGGLIKLNKAIATAAAGKNKEAAALFHHLGISLRDSKGHLRDVASLMPQLANAFEHTADPAMRVRMAMTLFGKAGAEMIPLLDLGADAIERLAKRGRELGYFATPEEKKNLLEYSRAMTEFNVATSAFSKEIGSKLAGVFLPVIKGMTDWVAANRDWLATGIVTKVNDLFVIAGKVLEPLGSATDIMKSLLAPTKDVGGAVTGVYWAFGGLALFMGLPFLSAGIKVIGTMTDLAALFAGPLVAGIKAASAASKVGEGAMRAFGIAVATNPLTIAIAATAALALAAYEVYENWDWVRKQLVAIWHGIEEVFKAGWETIKPIVEELKHFGSTNPSSDPKLQYHTEMDQYAEPEQQDPHRYTPSYRASPGYGGKDRNSLAPSAPNGHVDVRIQLLGAPPGTSVQTRSSGAVMPKVDLGPNHPTGLITPWD